MADEKTRDPKTNESEQPKENEKKVVEEPKTDDKGNDALSKILESITGISGRLEVLEQKGKTTDSKDPKTTEQDALKESIRREIFIDEMSPDFKDYLKGKKIDLEKSTYESLKAFKEIYKELKETKEAKENQKKEDKETPNPGKNSKNESEKKRLEEIKAKFIAY